MAYTKVLAVRTRLDRSVHYAINPQKTEQCLYTAALNCASTSTAYGEMMTTKRRFHKSDGVLGYHFIQSFKPGEVTPEQAHRIGVEFARRTFGTDYEVVVGTHLDQGHLHNHIVINSVSCRDGKKYHSSPASYYQNIRGESDRVCREENLSVIEPNGRGKHYAEWMAEKSGKPTKRDETRVDIDNAIHQSYTWSDFLNQMRKRGYVVVANPNHTYVTVRPPGGERSFRLTERSMGAAYSENAIKERLARQRSGEVESKIIQSLPPKRYHYSGSLKRTKRKKLTGFLALYWHYKYLLGMVQRGEASGRMNAAMRAEVRKLERYNRQFLFLYRNEITTMGELITHKTELEKQIAGHIADREPLYASRKEALDTGSASAITAEIEQINTALRKLRQELRLCAAIENSVPEIRAQDTQAHNLLHEQRSLERENQTKKIGGMTYERRQ